jgi:hypothetical protein
MDETKVNLESEKIDSPEIPTDEKKVDGAVDEILKDLPEEQKTEPKVVPEAAFLELKSELKALKKELKDAKTSEQKAVIASDIRDLTEKYPDVDKSFIQDILNSATIEATKKIEEKYTPILQKQEQEKKIQEFNKAFDNLYEKTLNENPELPSNIDKEIVKTLAMTPAYRKIPLSEVIKKIYGENTPSKITTENETRTGADKIDDIVSFEKITPEQKKAIMSDEKSRKKYFNWLDTQVG